MMAGWLSSLSVAGCNVQYLQFDELRTAGHAIQTLRDVLVTTGAGQTHKSVLVFLNCLCLCASLVAACEFVYVCTCVCVCVCVWEQATDQHSSSI